MRLEHYRKLYQNEARAFYSNHSQRDVVELLLSRFSIQDWKDFEKDQKIRESDESSQK